MSTTIKVERLVNLTVALLEARLPMNLAEIRRRTGYYQHDDAESARRMFERDKDDLRRLGVPVVTRAVGFSDDVGYLIDRSSYELPDIDLTRAEVAALAAAVSLSGADTLRLTLARLSARAPDPTSAIDDPGIRLAITLPVVEALAEPLLRRCAVTFDYRPAKADLASRTVDPYGIVQRRGVWYVIGRDHDRDAIRTFRLDRIVGDVATVGEMAAFDVPAGLSVAELFQQETQDTMTATVTAGLEMRWALEARGGQVVESHGEALTYQVTGIDPERDLGWLVGLSPHITVTSPADLVATIRDALEAVIQAHGGDAPAEGFELTGQPSALKVAHDGRALRRSGGASGDVARMLTLIPWLLERPGVSVAEAAAAFGVKETTIRRDLHHLDFCGLPGLGGGDLFEVDLVGDRVVVGMADELRRPLRPTPVEALQLVLAADAAADVVGDRLPALSSAVAKIRAALGISEDVADVIDSITADDERWQTLTRAIDERVVVTLRYRGRADVLPRERTVEPWRLLLDAGQWYLQGFDESAQAARTFRFDRILAVQPTGVARGHPVPSEPPMPRYEPSDDAITVIMEVAPQARWLLESVDVDMVGDVGPTTWVQLRTDAPRWIVELVLSAGGSVTLIAPGWLREQVADAAQRAQQRHRRR